MRTATLTSRFLAIALLAAGAGCALAASAQAHTLGQDRVQLAISQADTTPEQSAAQIVVQGPAGRYDRIVPAAVVLPLHLTVQFKPEASGFKVLKSELHFKTEGINPGAPAVDTLAGAPPVAAIDDARSHALTVSAQGPVAQNAVAACNGLATGEPTGARMLAMSLPVVWRVTTGKSTFKWTNYDHVAPSDEMINNRDFYGEHDVAEIEAPLNATVVCQPLEGAKVAAAAAPQKAGAVTPEPAVSPVSLPVSSPEPLPLTAKLNSDRNTETKVKPNAGAAQLTTAALPVLKPAVTPVSLAKPVSAPVRPQCDGGMVREVSTSDAGYVCLCPGNTERIATGSNAFACEKLSRRR